MIAGISSFCPNTYTFPKPDHINGGTHHFGSPFNFPEEFITVYRLHPLVPDLIEYRKSIDPDHIRRNDSRRRNLPKESHGSNA